jgi:hypothetical protein
LTFLSENIAIVRDITIIISLLTIAVSLFLSYRLYHRHLHTKRSYDLAQQTFRLIYTLNDTIAMIREPKERPHANDFVAKSSTVWQSQQEQYLLLSETLNKPFHNLEIALLEIEQRWGSKSAQTFTPFLDDITSLQQVIKRHLHALDPYDAGIPRSTETKKEDEKVLYAPTLGHDSYLENITEHIERIKNSLNRHLF